MFEFSPFRSPARQRKAVLAADSFAPLPLHPAVERQLEQAHNITTSKGRQLKTQWQLFFSVLSELASLVWALVGWSALTALVALSSVLVVRFIFQHHPGVFVGVTLGAAFLILKLTQALLDYQITNRRLQIHRGTQLALYRIVNAKLACIDPAGRSEFSSGQLKTLIGSDVESIEDFISAALMQWTPALVALVVIIPALWVISGVPGLVGLLVALTVVPIAAWAALYLERLQIKAQAEQDKLTTAIGEWVKHIRLVRFLGWGDTIEREINDQMGTYIWRAAIRYAAVVCVWALTITWPMLPLIAIAATSIASATPLNLVEIFSSLWVLDFLMLQLQHIPYSLALYGTACAGADRVIKLLEQPELSDSFITAAPIELLPTAIPTRLILRGVTKRFGSSVALHGITTTFDLTKKTAIVGSVASGKSTLLEVILGELPFTEGAIDIEFSDGTVGNLWHPNIYEAFRRSVAFSPQQPFLSNTSLLNNIDLSGGQSFEDVQIAASLARLADDIELFPAGFSEEVGESGINLSGGQRQRVSLARAFISGRPVMVLDDPLSAVDSKTEQELIKAICNRAKGFLLVSHRLSELERCDRVIVLEEGTIVEDGNPKDLAASTDSRFYRFLRAVEEHEH